MNEEILKTMLIDGTCANMEDRGAEGEESPY